MPRGLDTAKLQRKFASLTKSKESIQSVSSWIIHHSEFYKEIVDQWFIALNKDQNALFLFFVVNEIIHYCGDRRVPQFKEAFSKVLGKAVCLKKVKEIKGKLCPIFNLWRERKMFDGNFLKRLEIKLNAAEVPTLLTAAEDCEVCAKLYYDKSQSPNTKEPEATEKNGDPLKFGDGLSLSDTEIWNDKDECLKGLAEIDTCLVEESLKASDNEADARKNVIKELNRSSDSYTAQFGDVEKAAYEYMIYEKKLKNIERRIFEKKLAHLSQVKNSSSCFSENATCASPTTSTFFFDHDNASASRISKIAPASIKEKFQNTMLSSDGLNSSTSFRNKISSNTASGFPKNYEKRPEETLSKRINRASKQNLSKLVEIFSEMEPGSEKQSSLTGISDLSRSKVQKRNSSGLQIATGQQIKVPKNVELFSAAKSPNEKIILLDEFTEKTLNKKEETESDDEIQIVLEKLVNPRKAKSNINFKRKMEFLVEEEIRRVNKKGRNQNVSNIFMPSSKAIEKYKEMGFLHNRNVTQDSSSINIETSREDNKRNNTTVIPEPSFISERHFSEQTPTTFFDSSLVSSASSTSNKFLKNILEKNKSRPSENAEDDNVTGASAVKEYTDAGKLLENEDPENMINNPTHNSIYSEHFTTNEQEIQFFDTKSPKLVENDKKVSSPISNVQLESNDLLEPEKADDNPNFLQCLQLILEGIVNKSIFDCDFKKALNNPPIMPLENCFILYHILVTPDEKHAITSSPSSSQNIVPAKTVSESAVSSEIHDPDNLEVLDMECDSE